MFKLSVRGEHEKGVLVKKSTGENIPLFVLFCPSLLHLPKKEDLSLLASKKKKWGEGIFMNNYELLIVFLTVILIVVT